MSEIFNKNMKVNDHIDWRAMYDTMKADRDRLLSIIPCGDTYEALKDDMYRLKAKYEAVKVDRDNIRERLLSMIKEREESTPPPSVMADLDAVYGPKRTVYRVGSTLCCTCGARGEDTPSRLDDLEDRVSKLEAAKGGET